MELPALPFDGASGRGYTPPCRGWADGDDLREIATHDELLAAQKSLARELDNHSQLTAVLRNAVCLSAHDEDLLLDRLCVSQHRCAVLNARIACFAARAWPSGGTAEV